MTYLVKFPSAQEIFIGKLCKFGGALVKKFSWRVKLLMKKFEMGISFRKISIGYEKYILSKVFLSTCSKEMVFDLI